MMMYLLNVISQAHLKKMTKIKLHCLTLVNINPPILASVHYTDL